VVSVDPHYVPSENEVIRTVSVAADNPSWASSLTRVSPPVLQLKKQRDSSKPGWKNPYDISLQPFSSPPLGKAVSVVDLVSASSISPFENSPGPLTPQFLMTTPEPMILIPNSATSPQSGSGFQDVLPNIQKVENEGDLQEKNHDMNEVSKNALPGEMTRSRVGSW
jgi:hypothetical protein